MVEPFDSKRTCYLFFVNLNLLSSTNITRNCLQTGNRLRIQRLSNLRTRRSNPLNKTTQTCYSLFLYVCLHLFNTSWKPIGASYNEDHSCRVYQLLRCLHFSTTYCTVQVISFLRLYVSFQSSSQHCNISFT